MRRLRTQPPKGRCPFCGQKNVALTKKGRPFSAHERSDRCRAQAARTIQVNDLVRCVWSMPSGRRKECIAQVIGVDERPDTFTLEWVHITPTSMTKRITFRHKSLCTLAQRGERPNWAHRAFLHPAVLAARGHSLREDV